MDTLPIAERMVSYAGNCEDVLLARVFAGQARGFYIDVGANDPVDTSITKHFYDHGWSGINVEPAKRFHERLVACRPRDCNLLVAVSSHTGEMTFFDSVRPGYGGLSTLTPEVAETHRRAGLPIEERKVPVRRLGELCAEYVKGPIDFLSIDVEGHERAVLEGADFGRFRPRVVLLEATYPNTQTPTHKEWESLILGADYVFALFDGVTRYYVRAEEPALLERFRSPVCVFDQYIPIKYATLERHDEEMGRHARAMELHLQGLSSERDQLRIQLSTTEAELQALRTQLADLQHTYRSIGRGTVAAANQFSAVKQRLPRLLAAARSRSRSEA